MKGYDVSDKKGSKTSIPIRYGGDYAIKGQSPLIWLHCNEKLREAGLGTAIGEGSKIHTCSQDEATQAISYNVAKPEGECVVVSASILCKRPRYLTALTAMQTFSL